VITGKLVRNMQSIFSDCYDHWLYVYSASNL